MYEEAPDGKGFFLPSGEYFQFDAQGGWFDESGCYYNASGVPSPPPAPLQGKNRGFNTNAYSQYGSKPQGGFGGGGYGQQGYKDNSYNENRHHGGYGGGGGNRRREYDGGGGRNKRRYDEDFDDDPINQEFGGDDNDDYYHDSKQQNNKEEEERLERAFKAEKKKEDLLIYIQDRLNKEVINLYLDVMSTGKEPAKQSDVEALLSSNGIKDAKLEEKKSASTSTTLVFNLHLKTKDQALKVLSIEGQSKGTAKITCVEIPSAKLNNDHDDEEHDEKDVDKHGDSEHSEGDDEEGEEESFSEGKETGEQKKGSPSGKDDGSKTQAKQGEDKSSKGNVKAGTN